MEYPLWLTELPSTDILSNKWRQGTVLKGNKQCKEDYIKAVGDRCQLSSVQGVSATGLSKRISPPFVAVGGTVGKFASRINAGVCKTEFINHISISTYHKLVHVNPHDVRWKAHTGVHASSGFVIQYNVSWWCWVDFKWRIKDFIWSFCSFLILGSIPVWLLARVEKHHGAPSWKWKVHRTRINKSLSNTSLMLIVVCLMWACFDPDLSLKWPKCTVYTKPYDLYASFFFKYACRFDLHATYNICSLSFCR